MRQIDSKKGMTAFFEKHLENGQNAEELYSVLLNQGYPKSIINDGYNQALINIRQKKEAETPKVETPEIEIVTETPERKSFFQRIFKKN
ncbi:MAG: hypothetical protein NUV46_03350 [Nanoarchaeota archaeon]|nr:hypothetical protein [Nanoarchaeota archaeon]